MKFFLKYGKILFEKIRKEAEMKKIIYITLGLFLLYGSISFTNSVYSAPSATVVNQSRAVQYSNTNPLTVSSLEVVKYPQKYLNKTITMKATFDKFSTLGLDYKPAMRSSQDYIGILIKRDDVIDHNVPLSEMKMFLKRDLAEKNIDLETDDKVQITGNVFSTALGDPWVDITEIKVLQKAPKTDKK